MKLKESLATETYLSEGGYYCISQENSHDDPSVVSLTPTQMRFLIRDMETHLANTDWFQEGITED